LNSNLQPFKAKIWIKQNSQTTRTEEEDSTLQARTSHKRAARLIKTGRFAINPFFKQNETVKGENQNHSNSKLEMLQLQLKIV